MTSSKSFLVINCRASFSFVSFMCERVASKYWNSLLVGLSVERAPNFQHAFLGTLSFIAKLYQFPRASDVPSRAKAISSRISPCGEAWACIFLGVITSRTFSSSAQPAVNEMIAVRSWRVREGKRNLRNNQLDIRKSLSCKWYVDTFVMCYYY